jgi:hypothetical protein
MVAVSVAPAGAGVVLDITGGSTQSPSSDLTAGWEFEVLSTIVVNGLGLWAEGSNGLTNSHAVGLWNSDGSSLLASTTITSASTPTPWTSSDGQWLFNSIAPLTLSPGTYVIGATIAAHDPDLTRLQASATTIPEVTFVEARTSLGSSLTFPTSFSEFGTSFFGPNLRSEAVPAPLSLALLGLGFVGLAARRMMRRQ